MDMDARWAKKGDEIGLNYDVGAVGTYAHANTTIRSTWSLLSINGENSGKVGTTYMGTVGKPVNLINIVIDKNADGEILIIISGNQQAPEKKREPVLR